MKDFESDKNKWIKYGKPSGSIFIDSMSDMGTWEQEWVNKAINDNPQHRYIALTKRYDRLMELLNRASVGVVNNLYIGTSVTTQEQANKYATQFPDFPDFFSIEPILEPIQLVDYAIPKTLIIGAETGNRKEKVIPQKEWITSLVKQADRNNCVVFMKGSLRNIMGDDFRQDKLLWAVKP